MDPAAPPPAPGAPPRLAPGLGAARALLALAGLGLLALSAALLVERNFVLTPTNIAGLAGRVAFAAALLGVAAAPARAAALLRAPGLATPSGLGAFALAAGALYFIFGLGTLVETASLLERIAAGEAPGDVVSDIDRERLVASLLINFTIFLVPALAWASAAERNPGRRALDWLRLRREGARWSVIWAVCSVVLVFWFLIAAGLVSRAVSGAEVPNERAEAIARQLDIPTAILVAALTGLGEEIFFRGFLLRKVGNVPQALLFGIAHLNYLQVFEVTVTAALGYMFGRTVQRTGSLWGPVLGHAAFNAASLIIVILRAQGAFPG